MKKIITIFILLLTISTSIFSKEKKETCFIWEDVEYNSISATIDENTLYIYSDKQYENLDVQIQGINGIIVYTKRVSLQAGEKLTVPLSKLSERTDQTVLIVNDRRFDIIPVK